MPDPILHSVSEPPTAVEVKESGISSAPRVAELLQAIYTVSRTAATSMNLGRPVDTAKDLQIFRRSCRCFGISLDAGYQAVNKVCSEVEELAKLLKIDLKKPTSYRLKPVFNED